MSTRQELGKKNIFASKCSPPQNKPILMIANPLLSIKSAKGLNSIFIKVSLKNWAYFPKDC